MLAVTRERTGIVFRLTVVHFQFKTTVVLGFWWFVSIEIACRQLANSRMRRPLGRERLVYKRISYNLRYRPFSFPVTVYPHWKETHRKRSVFANGRRCRKQDISRFFPFFWLSMFCDYTVCLLCFSQIHKPLLKKKTKPILKYATVWV